MRIHTLLFKISLFLLLLFTVPTYAKSENKTSNKATILALGMEMSNMRNMLEAYILIGANIDYKNPKEKLANGIKHYELLLLFLKNTYKDDAIQKSVQKSEVAWANVKKAMETALKSTDIKQMKKGAIFIHGNIRTVIRELASMKTYFLGISDIKDKEDLNAAIEIAASARRLSAHYMMDLWHLDDPTIEAHWNKGLKIYGDSVQILEKSSYIKNSRFRQLLYGTKRLHQYFTKMGKKRKIYSILIDKKADIAFKKAKEMTEIILHNKHL